MIKSFLASPSVQRTVIADSRIRAGALAAQLSIGRHLDRPVVVAVVAVRMVQVAVDEIVNVVPVRHCRVAAVQAVNMARSVVVAVVIANAAVGIGRRHFEDALVDVIAVRVMQMAVMQIVDVAIVFDRQVAAARTMLMFVLLHFCTGSHNEILLKR